MSLQLPNPFAHVGGRRLLRRAALGLGAFAILALPSSGAGAQGPSSTATVRFGNPTVGSPFPTGPGTIPHDESVNAKDNMIPRQVVIAAGGTVTFDIPSAHQPAIYLPG